jgi:NAD dependent epimerase/dehydratase
LDEDLRGKKVLVTGAGGFIGSHLSEELVRAGAEVTALVRYNSFQSHGMLEELPEDLRTGMHVVLGDVRDPFCVSKFVSGCHVVFHLAALIGIPYSYHAPKSYVDTNVSGTLNVLQACLEHSVKRLVHTSTSEVYGSARYTPIDENHRLQGQSPYSASKIAADKLAESYHLSFGLPVVTIRPFNCYGPRQSGRAFIPAMISQALREDEIRCGSLETLRDYTFVKDTVAGFIACATKPAVEGRTINVGTDAEISMGALLDKILARMGVSRKIVVDQARLRPPNSEVMELMCDNSLARKLLDWVPKVSLDDGLDQVISYVTRSIANYRTTSYVI